MFVLVEIVLVVVWGFEPVVAEAVILLVVLIEGVVVVVGEDGDEPKRGGAMVNGEDGGVRVDDASWELGCGDELVCAVGLCLEHKGPEEDNCNMDNT